MEDEKEHMKKLRNPNKLNKTWFLPHNLWDYDIFNMGKEKGYILASFIFYHNVLHRLKVLAPKHGWEITLSSRAARQKKFHKKELFLKSSTEIGTQAPLTEENTLLLHNSSGWKQTAHQWNSHQPQYPEFYCQGRNPPLIVAPMEEMQWKQRMEYFPHGVIPRKTEQWWFRLPRPKQGRTNRAVPLSQCHCPSATSEAAVTHGQKVPSWQNNSVFASFKRCSCALSLYHHYWQKALQSEFSWWLSWCRICFWGWYLLSKAKRVVLNFGSGIIRLNSSPGYRMSNSAPF